MLPFLIYKSRHAMPKKIMSNAIQSEQTVKIGEKDVVVKKISLLQMANLFKAIEALPSEFLNQKDAENTDFVRQLPSLVMEILPKCADLVAETLENQIEGSELLEADFDDVLGLVEAFLEVNKVAQIVARLGKVKALATGKNVQQAIG